MIFQNNTKSINRQRWHSVRYQRLVLRSFVRRSDILMIHSSDLIWWSRCEEIFETNFKQLIERIFVLCYMIVHMICCGGRWVQLICVSGLHNLGSMLDQSLTLLNEYVSGSVPPQRWKQNFKNGRRGISYINRRNMANVVFTPMIYVCKRGEQDMKCFIFKTSLLLGLVFVFLASTALRFSVRMNLSNIHLIILPATSLK